MKHLISIKEFIHLSQLNTRDVIEMLDNGELPFENGALGELLIKIDEVNPETIAFRKRPKQEQLLESESVLLEELIASEIVSGLNEMLDDAIELATRWNNKPNN